MLLCYDYHYYILRPLIISSRPLYAVFPFLSENQ